MIPGTVIDATLRTIERRARLYRRLVQVLVFAGALFVALAIFVSVWALLYAPAIAVLLVTGWMAMDAAVLNRWRQSVLKTRIAPRSLMDAFEARSDVPQNTVTDMVNVLSASPRSGRRALLASLALVLALACGARAIQARSWWWGVGGVFTAGAWIAVLQTSSHSRDSGRSPVR